MDPQLLSDDFPPAFCARARPLVVPQVAARAVEALMRGDRTVIPGWQNKFFVHVLSPLVSGCHAAVDLEYRFSPEKNGRGQI